MVDKALLLLKKHLDDFLTYKKAIINMLKQIDET
jgi:hypothetical protein